MNIGLWEYGTVGNMDFGIMGFWYWMTLTGADWSILLPIYSVLQMLTPIWPVLFFKSRYNLPCLPLESETVGICWPLLAILDPCLTFPPRIFGPGCPLFAPFGFCFKTTWQLNIHSWIIFPCIFSKKHEYCLYILVFQSATGYLVNLNPFQYLFLLTPI